MRSAAISLILVLSAATHLSPARAQCPPKATTSNEQNKGTQPATVGKDGTGTTDTSGGHGGLQAGIENEKKGQATEPVHSKEAKGLDLKKETPQPKC
jgi:hypothetical protein